MSGAHNQVQNKYRGIVWHEPQGPSGKFDKYKSQIKIIVSGGDSKKSKRVFYLTNAVYEALGKPRYVRIGSMGTDVIFMKSEDQQGAYSITQARHSNGQEHGSKFVNAASFIEKYEIKRGVYDARIEEGMVIFNKDQMPASI